MDRVGGRKRSALWAPVPGDKRIKYDGSRLYQYEVNRVLSVEVIATIIARCLCGLTRDLGRLARVSRLWRRVVYSNNDLWWPVARRAWTQINYVFCSPERKEHNDRILAWVDSRAGSFAQIDSWRCQAERMVLAQPRRVLWVDVMDGATFFPTFGLWTHNASKAFQDRLSREEEPTEELVSSWKKYYTDFFRHFGSRVAVIKGAAQIQQDHYVEFVDRLQKNHSFCLHWVYGHPSDFRIRDIRSLKALREHWARDLSHRDISPDVAKLLPRTFCPIVIALVVAYVGGHFFCDARVGAIQSEAAYSDSRALHECSLHQEFNRRVWVNLDPTKCALFGTNLLYLTIEIENRLLGESGFRAVDAESLDPSSPCIGTCLSAFDANSGQRYENVGLWICGTLDRIADDRALVACIDSKNNKEERAPSVWSRQVSRPIGPEGCGRWGGFGSLPAPVCCAGCARPIPRITLCQDCARLATHHLCGECVPI